MPGSMVLVQEMASEVLRVAETADVRKKIWIDRYLSVSYPLRHIRITSPYGYRKDPFTGKRKFHGGIDLHARSEKVLVMMDGVVVKVGQDKTSGKYVTLQHGNYLISYCHLSRVLAVKGAVVHPRDVVGITGSTGRSTGEHLHITCKLNGKSINPMLLLDFIKATQQECVSALLQTQKSN
ncbi:M23 family metallopeptidase [Bacteroides sp. f07]